MSMVPSTPATPAPLPATPPPGPATPSAPSTPAPATPPPDAPVGNVLIARLGAKADLSDEALLPRGPERRAAVWSDLVDTAAKSQAPALARLEALRAAGHVAGFESLAMPNAILVTTADGRHQAVRDALAGVAEIADVSENRRWSVRDTEAVEVVAEPRSAGALAGIAALAYARGFVDGPAWLDPEAGRRAAREATAPVPEWGVERIGAPQAWKAGLDGTGVTIGIVDTGLDTSHPAIAAQYRGTRADGTQVHDHNWFDPFARTSVPSDDGEHGTHVAGASAGRSSQRAIGVAPGARLIAAKAIDGAGYNSTAATLQALQFMLAPSRTDGSDPDPTRGADVVNNSWGNSDQADETFVDSLAALRAAGIEVVNAAGNDGPAEGTVSPPGSYPGYLSVAATDEADAVAGFSSRGPSRFTSPDDMTPNVSAPGAGIVSAVPGGRYQRASGTSMAAPHVAGAVAILLQAAPQATHDQVVQALTRSTVDIDRPGPDNASGFGRIDLPAAIAWLRAAAPAGETGQ